jgi:hypothetical protein
MSSPEFNQEEWEKEFPKFTGITWAQFKRAFEIRYGFPIEHTKMRHGDWRISKFTQEDFDTLGRITYGEHGNLIQKLERLTEEIESKPQSTIKRLQHYHNPNILLLVGITESLKRDTNEITTTPPSGTSGVQYIGCGTDGTAENQSQTGLIAAYGSRKNFDTQGQRKVINQTAKYNMTFNDTDLALPVIAREAATYNLSTGGIPHARLQFPDFLLEAGQVMTFQINESQVNG